MMMMFIIALLYSFEKYNTIDKVLNCHLQKIAKTETEKATIKLSFVSLWHFTIIFRSDIIFNDDRQTRMYSNH